MNKEQRILVSKLICEAAIKNLTKKFGKTLKEFKAEIVLSRNWHQDSANLSLKFDDDTLLTTKKVKAMLSKAYRDGEYTVKLNPVGKLEAVFNKSVINRKNWLIKPVSDLRTAVREFNLKLENDFMLQTSFAGIEDVQDFIKTFAKNI